MFDSFQTKQGNNATKFQCVTKSGKKVKCQYSGRKNMAKDDDIIWHVAGM